MESIPVFQRISNLIGLALAALPHDRDAAAQYLEAARIEAEQPVGDLYADLDRMADYYAESPAALVAADRFALTAEVA